MEAVEDILADTANLRLSMVQHFGLQEGDRSHDSEDGFSTLDIVPKPGRRNSFPARSPAR
jgi:hypothetical protein